MKKKSIGIALVCVLALSLVAGCTPAGTQGDAPTNGAQSTAAVDGAQSVGEDEMYYFDDPGIGLRLRWPDAWYTALYEKPCLVPMGLANGLAFDYITQKGSEAQNKLYSDQNLPDDPAQFTPEQKELVATMEKNIIPLCAIIAEKDGKRDEETRGQYTAETALGEKNGTVYTLLTKTDADLSELSAEEKAEYEALLTSTAEFEKELALSGMQDMFSGDKVTFDSQTLNGEKIDSSVLEDHKLTAINLWATWCGPCIQELPELQKLYEDMPEGTNLLSICTDGEEESELAKKIQDESGMKYPTIVANKEMLEGFLANVQSFPTTIFVDSEGNMVGEPLVGVPSGDVVEGYRAAIEERLALLAQN